MTAPLEAVAPDAADHRARLSRRRLPGHHILRRRRRQPAALPARADAGFETAAGWLDDGMAAAFRAGAARLAIVGEDPNLLSGQDPEKSPAPTAPARSPTARRWN